MMLGLTSRVWHYVYENKGNEEKHNCRSSRNEYNWQL